MPRQGVKTALLNTQKQTQGGCQIEETKKYGPNERVNKNPEKELSKMEIANLSDAEFKTLVIKMLKELIELKEEMKDTLSEIKKSLQGNISEGKEVGIQINDLEHKKEINIHTEQNEETRIQQNEDSIRQLWDISKHANIRIIGMPEGEEEEQ